MRQQEVFKKIGNILQELNEQYNYLKTYDHPIDDLELELFAANSHFLGDHVEILRKLNANAVPAFNKPEANFTAEADSVPTSEVEEGMHEATHVEVPSTIAEVMPVIGVYHVDVPPSDEETDTMGEFEFDMTTPGHTVEQTEEIDREFDRTVQQEPDSEPVASIHSVEEDAPQINLGSDSRDDAFSYVRSTEPGTIYHSLELNEAESVKEDEPHEETVAEALAQVEITPEPVEEPEVNTNEQASEMPDREEEQSERPMTLNERMSAQMSSQNMQSAQASVADLKAAININDKMLFVRDLFKGYSLAYSEAIEILNRFNNFEDAQRFLTNNYVTKNAWADKPATADKFYAVLKRRFPN